MAIILLACGSCVVIVNCWNRFCTLGRAPGTKETLLDFHEWCWVTRNPRVFRGLTDCQRTPGVWGVTAIVFLGENGNNRSLLTYGLTLFSFTVFVILKNLSRCSLGSSLGCLMNWCCCTMVIKAGFNLKFFDLIAGCLTVEYSSLIIGLQKSSIVLYLY